MTATVAASRAHSGAASSDLEQRRQEHGREKQHDGQARAAPADEARISRQQPGPGAAQGAGREKDRQRHGQRVGRLAEQQQEALEQADLDDDEPQADRREVADRGPGAPPADLPERGRSAPAAARCTG